jgi:malonyl-CoA O-methyltransferase
VRFVAHDLTTSFPFHDASFDAMLCAMVLEHIAGLGPFFAEIARVARPDGRVVVTAMHPAMFLKGVSASFVHEGGEVRPRSYRASMSDYVMAALAAGLRIVDLSEHSPDESLAARFERARKWIGWPALLVMTLANGAESR